MINEDLSGTNSKTKSIQNLPVKRPKHTPDSSDDESSSKDQTTTVMVAKGDQVEKRQDQSKLIVNKRPHLIQSEQYQEILISTLMNKEQHCSSQVQNQSKQYYVDLNPRTNRQISNNLHDDKRSFAPRKISPPLKSPTSSQHLLKQSTSKASSELDENLVKCVDDLPQFITIEGFRVAAYSNNGEPFLCLPQLLQYLRQNFDLQRIVEGFESAAISFPSASTKQVNGFVKACVLSSNYESCSLIRRSDAERVCLRLYEGKYAKKAPADLQIQLKRLDDLTSECSNTTQSTQSVSSCDAQNSNSHEDTNVQDLSNNLTNKDPVQETKRLESQNLKSNEIYEKNDSGAVVLQKTQLFSNELRGYGRSVDKLLAMAARFRMTRIEDLLFNSELQRPMLALAKVSTSSLTIRVYHRCFGKCMGLYYPALLFDSDSECIECTSCHMMFSPRHFVGHSHGSRENEVTHWGFNSYNWRHYIRLSRKQTMNKLDDDELLSQFRALKSSPDGPDEPVMGVEPSVDSFEDISISERTRKKKEIKSHQSSSLPSISKTKKEANFDLIKSPQLSSSSDYSDYLTLAAAALNRSSSFKDNINVYNMRQSATTWNEQQRQLQALAEASISGTARTQPRNRNLDFSDAVKDHSDNYYCDLTASSARGTLAPFISPYQADSLISASISTLNFDGNVLSRRNLTDFSGQTNLSTAAMLSSSLARQQPQSLILTKNDPISNLEQDRYICSQLTTYLSNKGLNSNLAADIVASALRIIRESRNIT